MFTGLSAFPLTPLANDAVDEANFTGMARRLAAAQVDSITALGSHRFLRLPEHRGTQPRRPTDLRQSLPCRRSALGAERAAVLYRPIV